MKAILCVICVFSCYAFGQTVDELPALAPDVHIEKGFLEQLMDPEFVAKLGGFVVMFLAFMRGLADLLLWFSAKTENKWDNRLANAISSATWFVGVLVSKAGWSTPKALITEKVKEATSDGKPA